MFDLAFWTILVRAIGAVVIFTVHGVTLAYLARLLGDRGPQYDGRLTLNPFVHVDVFGLLGAVSARIGWMKPMTIDKRQLRFGAAGLILCVAVSLLVVLALAHIAILVRPALLEILPDEMNVAVFSWIRHFADLAVWFVIFNLVPIPPMTGGLILAAVSGALYRRVMEYVLWISVALAAFLALTRGWGVHSYLRPVAELLMP